MKTYHHAVELTAPGGVFWLSFGDPAAVADGVAACGRAEHLALHPDFDSLPFDRQVRLVRAAWREPLPRLLVFDNCEDESLLAEWRPPTGGCRVLVTSRRARWSPALVSQVLRLHALERAESLALLRAYCANLPDAESVFASPAALADLEAIAAELGDLPLALHLAGSYLAHRYLSLSPASYLAELRGAQDQAHTHSSLQGGDFSPTRHDQHIARAFALSYRRLRPEVPTDLLALRLLARAACFAPGETLPRALLLATVTDPEAAPHALGEDALTRLVGDLGLIEPREGGALRMHRLVAGFVRAVAADAEAQMAVERVVLAEAQRLNEDRLPMPMRALQPHLRAVTGAAIPRTDTLAAELCAELGWQLVLLDMFSEAQRVIAQSLAIREALLGPDHPDVATSLSLLGLSYQFQGAFAAARAPFERALDIHERALGPDHLETATDCNNLGYLLFHLDGAPGARSYLRRALLIRKRTLGLRDAGTARTLNNLGYVELRTGRIAAGRRYLKLALAIREQVLPANHVSTAQTLNNLGEALLMQGDYVGARRCHERALAMRNTVFGPNHFHAAESMRSLAHVLQAQGDLAAARAHLERALAICVSTLGEQHIETAWKIEAMGNLLYDQADYVAARSYLQRALAVYRELLDPEHPSIAQVRERLERIEADGLP
ncbi:tetratricopeptide repeat protein [Oscillochloris sp. ZM17-4]|uniref:tetratricopeptide repeat protein n=1 Tax=Oscillochloris sp. ZM17-4 TaxID=2866714 RepID=UPI001C731017|nr:tetratricopeptide repeat protein [Oscillochloris sp. ZM17-4]MBX0327119.1 tetratricopeptide repeat protein [Oscillochloris sp. ZM17-4]